MRKTLFPVMDIYIFPPQWWMRKVRPERLSDLCEVSQPGRSGAEARALSASLACLVWLDGRSPETSLHEVGGVGAAPRNTGTFS